MTAIPADVLELVAVLEGLDGCYVEYGRYVGDEGGMKHGVKITCPGSNKRLWLIPGRQDYEAIEQELGESSCFDTRPAKSVKYDDVVQFAMGFFAS